MSYGLGVLLKGHLPLAALLAVQVAAGAGVWGDDCAVTQCAGGGDEAPVLP
ncbi:hypothetical protein KIF59_06760 [Enterobacter cloacae subsp. cloacae]|nr:hypothetical protein [Enterobacter cloacae subsp. cloacae]